MSETQTAAAWYDRCTACDFGKQYVGEDADKRARAYQRRHPCPHCHRGLACAQGRLSDEYSAEGDAVEARL